jgi:GT2 family glycosyltransferase
VSGSAWPLVSIVFLAYNRRGQLATSLDRVLAHLDYPADRLEVIVVDNASVDGTAEMVAERFPSVRVIRSPANVGMSAWNLGMKAAAGRWRLALDDDCYIDGDALETAVRCAEEHDADLVSFRVRSGEQPEYWFNDQYDTGLLTFWGCSAMFSQRVIEAEPFYDPNIFIWANEMELTMRLLDRGYRHLHLPEVTSVHMKGPKLVWDERAFRLNTRHFAYIAAKLMQPRDVAIALTNLALHVVAGAVVGDVRKLHGLGEIVRGTRNGLGVRAPVRPKVSRVYRRHTWHFGNPVAQARTVDRTRVPGQSEMAWSQRYRRWFAGRAEYYPASMAVLEL